MNVRALGIALILAFIVAGSGISQEWLYVSRGGAYVAYDPSGGTVVHSDVFEGSSGDIEIVPTPGGAYVFFFDRPLNRAFVVDTNTHEVAWVEQLPPGTERIQFNSMGEQVIAEVNGNRIAIAHRRGRLGDESTLEANLDLGQVAFNRRATRVYGSRGNSLEIVLAADGSRVASVRTGGAFDWRTSPNFRYLLGTDSRGKVILVDEQRARSVGTQDGLSDSVWFTSDSRQIHALDGDGETVVTLDTRRFRVQDRIEIDVPLSHMWLSADGRHHGLSRDAGRLVFDASGAVVSVQPNLPGQGPLRAALVVVRPDQGFACF